MCFSPTASFTAAAALTVVGLGTMRAAPTERDLPFASMPLFFALQQFTEGLVWHHLDRVPSGAAVGGTAVDVYVAFSHVFWPAFVPLVILLIEPSRRRRAILIGFAALGITVAAILGQHIARYGVSAHVARHSIHYRFPHLQGDWLVAPYLAATCLSCLVSSHRAVVVFGAVALVLALVADHIATFDFVSVWCFYAAILSTLVAWYVFDARSNAARNDLLTRAIGHVHEVT